MECQPSVKPLVSEVLEICDVPGGVFREKLEKDVTFSGFEDGTPQFQYLGSLWKGKWGASVRGGYANLGKNQGKKEEYLEYQRLHAFQKP